MEKERQLIIKLLGGLSIEGMGGSVTMESLHSPMLTKLLAYLLCHNKEKCMVQDLIEALWPDDETDNPAGALKNLMYRLRIVLKKEWPELELILTGKGFYQWNNQIPAVIDLQEFESCIKAATFASDEQTKMEFYRTAVSAFDGQLLAGMNDSYWMAALTTYYFSSYLSAVKSLCAILEKNCIYDEMEMLCRFALEEDPLDGELHYFFIKSLYGQQKYQLAVEQYHKAENILYDNLGIKMPEQARRLYTIMMEQNHDEAANLDGIIEDLRQTKKSGAFYCEYGVFKQIFQLQIRRAERLGISVFLGLVTITPSELLLKNPKYYREVLAEASLKLREVLTNSLRSGDVLTRYSENQYLILLPTCQYESLKKIEERIRWNYFKGKSKRMFELKFEFSEID